VLNIALTSLLVYSCYLCNRSEGCYGCMVTLRRNRAARVCVGANLSESCYRTYEHDAYDNTHTCIILILYGPWVAPIRQYTTLQSISFCIQYRSKCIELGRSRRYTLFINKGIASVRSASSCTLPRIHMFASRLYPIFHRLSASLPLSTAHL
jgi:hypothetical protein